MGRIAINILPGQLGHLNCGLAFAKLLRSAGHEVVFTGHWVDDLSVTGFDFVPLATRQSGDDSLAQEREAKAAEWLADPPATTRQWLARKIDESRFIWRQTELQRERHRFLLESAPSLSRHGWDVFVNDYNDPLGALLAHKAGLHTVLLATGVYELDRRVPPVSSDATFDGSYGSIARTWLEWKKRDAARALRRFTPLGFSNTLLARHAVRASGVPRRRLRSRTDMQLDLLTLVTYPEAFDFPHVRQDNAFYVEPLVDMDREPPLPASRFKAGKRIVYASMGTQAWNMRDPVGFFQMLIDALGHEPDLQLLLNVGGYCKPSVLRLTPNVDVLPWAPQLGILARASLAITHGGMSTVKECIYSGVPMVALPLQYDQPGSAARVRHHGLGLTARASRLNATQTRAMCREVLDDPAYAMRVAQMRETFVRAQSSGASVQIIERVLASSRTAKSVR